MSEAEEWAGEISRIKGELKRAESVLSEKQKELRVLQKQLREFKPDLQILHNRDSDDSSDDDEYKSKEPMTKSKAITKVPRGYVLKKPMLLQYSPDRAYSLECHDPKVMLNPGNPQQCRVLWKGRYIDSSGNKKFKTMKEALVSIQKHKASGSLPSKGKVQKRQKVFAIPSLGKSIADLEGTPGFKKFIHAHYGPRGASSSEDDVPKEGEGGGGEGDSSDFADMSD